MNTLNRTVPFLATDTEQPVIVLDRFMFPCESLVGNQSVLQKLASSICLSEFADTLDADAAIAIVSEQYDAGAEFVYGHPIWEEIRRGSRASVYSYLLETRHYLAAASSRMAPSVHHGIGLDPLTLLLSKHLLEEFDHAKFFEDALVAMGCARSHITWSRPLPSTLEWIHFTRAVASRDSLAAALCSGFMEYSSRETKAVLGWHEHLVDTGLIPADANAAIFKHVETDLGFGHDRNWEYALQHAAPVQTRVLASALDDVAALCEMIYRWLTALRNGLSSYVVAAMQVGCVPPPLREAETNAIKSFGGLVWPSSCLRMVNHGTASNAEGASSAIAVAYSHGEFVETAETTDFQSAVNLMCRQATMPSIKSIGTAAGLYEVACSWLRAIDGHELWEAMVKQPSFSLIQGFILENYHYLASATRHISAAIAACPDGLIQLDLIAHLEDELEHCELLRKVLEETEEISNVTRCRPLPTTTAFVGYLQDLAVNDWRGYLIASAFLQGSLAECRADRRQARFYSDVIKLVPAARYLLEPLHRHDEIDGELGHDCRATVRLEKLVARNGILLDSVERASLTPHLAWSFLDGILRHYVHGSASISQRISWAG